MKKIILLVLVLALCTAAEVANADFTFGEPVNLESVIPLIDPADESIDCFSSDGLEMYICSLRPGGQGRSDLWVLRRSSVDEEWGPPENLGLAVNSPDRESDASISADGLTLYFTSDRSGENGPEHICVTMRPTKDSPWGQAVAMEPPVNSSSWDGRPCISADGLELYFSSGRSGGFGPYYDLWVTKRATTDDAWGEPENLGAVINTPHTEGDPHLSPDGRLMFFDDGSTLANETRPGGYGADDIWMTMRQTLSDPWQIPVNLGPKVNSSKAEFWPCISPDGSMLYFTTWDAGTWENWVSSIIPIVDFNGDGIVDAADMCIMVDYWGTDEPLCDIGPMPWGDGIVDVEDLKVLAEHLFEDYRLIAHWKLDETEGDIAHDSIGGNDSYIIGGAIWQSAGGRVGGALLFDGTNDYISPPFILNPRNGSFSAFTWIKGGAPGQVIISQADSTGLSTRWLWADPSYGRLMSWLMHPPFDPLVSESVITDDQWHHIGLVYDIDGLKRYLYVDGKEVAKDTDVVGGVDSDGRMCFGVDRTLDAASFFSGLIDDVRIYDAALNAEEIATLAQ